MTSTAAGTKDDPWQLATPPGTSTFQMWTDDTADPPALVCQVGHTQLRYHRRAVGDLHAMLKTHGGSPELTHDTRNNSMRALRRAPDRSLR